MIPRDVVTAVAAVALLSLLIFVGRFHWSTRGAWRQTAVGRNAMSTTLVLAAVLALNVVSRILGPGYVGQQVAAIIVYAGVAGVAWQRIVLQYRAQRGDREDD